MYIVIQTASRQSRVGVRWFGSRVAYKDILQTKEKSCLRPYEIADVRESSKIPKFFEMSPLSRAGKHPDFQVTLCLQNVSTNLKFDE